jgi:ABC-type bacteriocin/lantibiotic exporter with double-glycine peptidase domain
MRHPIQEIFTYVRLFQKYLGNKMFLLVPLSILASVFESIGVLMFVPLIENLTGNSSSALEGINFYINTILTFIGLRDSISTVFILIAVSFSIKGVFIFFILKFIALLRAELLIHLKSTLYDSIIKMNYSYYLQKETGHFVNTINEQVNRTLISFTALMNFFALFFSVIIYLIIVLLVSFQFSIIVTALSVTVFFAFNKLNIMVRILSREIAGENGKLESLIINNIRLFKYIKVTCSKYLLHSDINSTISRLANAHAKTVIYAGLIRSFKEPVAAIIILIAVYVEVIYFSNPIGPIIVAIFLLYRSINAIFGMQKKFTGMLSSIGSLEMVDKEFINLEENTNSNEGVLIEPLSRSIILKNVSFSYQNSDSYQVKNINLLIKANKTLAIVGKSGSGKSSLVDIISKLNNPQNGEVYIDDIPLSTINSDSWNSQIGYVFDGLDLISGSVADNITLFNGDTSKDLKLFKKVTIACKKTLAHEFINLLPDGYETIIGDGGISLSSGQKQRLFIARELFKEPSLLILDEATNSLDSINQRAITDTIESLKGQITLVIIAHRLSTIRNADTVIVMDNGKIIEQGDYNSLRLKNGSIFNSFIDVD